MKPEAMKLDKMLRELLRRHAWTVPKLSQRTGVPVNTIHNWLAGQTPRRLEHLRLVAECFDVTLDYLLFGVERRIGEVEILALLHSGQYEIVVRRAVSSTGFKPQTEE